MVPGPQHTLIQCFDLLAVHIVHVNGYAIQKFQVNYQLHGIPGWIRKWWIQRIFSNIRQRHSGQNSALQR